MMRSFVIVSAALCAFAVAACGAAPSASDVDSSAASATAAPTLDSLGKSLVGKYTDSGLADTTAEFATLELHLDGTYVGTKKNVKTAEKGTFTASASAKTLTLAPKSGAKRIYAVEIEDTMVQLTNRKTKKAQVLMYSGVSECAVDSDCGTDAVCTIGDSSRTCGTKGGTGPGTKPNVACDDRRDGALITFKIAGVSGSPDGKHDSHDETFSVWSTNSEFIARAKSDLATIPGSGNGWGTPNFDKFIIGADSCNPGYTWHVDAQSMAFADFTIELCDGSPEYLEKNQSDWSHQVGRYCPWGPEIVKVDDRRIKP